MSRKAKRRHQPNSKQKHRSVSVPKRKVSRPIQKGLIQKSKRRPRRNKRKKSEQESKDVNPHTTAESNFDTAPQNRTAITSPVDVPETDPAVSVNRDATKDDDEEKDQVIEQHFNCVAKMMPSELVSPS
jgi:hypothetical protein